MRQMKQSHGAVRSSRRSWRRTRSHQPPNGPIPQGKALIGVVYPNLFEGLGTTARYPNPVPMLRLALQVVPSANLFATLSR